MKTNISFTEITHRFQTARAEVQALLLQCLQPWLENMELVAASVPPATPLSLVSCIYCVLLLFLLLYVYLPTHLILALIYSFRIKCPPE